MKRIIGRFTIMTLIVSGFIFIISAPASASYSQCPSQPSPGWTCIWPSYNGANPNGVPGNAPVGAPMYFAQPPSGTCRNVPPEVNDKSLSYYNRRSDKHVSFYEHANCQGRRLQTSGQPVPPMSSGNFLQLSPFVDNRNKLSSIFIHTG